MLKRAIGLKTSYVQAFGKLLVFVDQMYHTLENTLKHKNWIEMVKIQTCAPFSPKTCNWA